MKKMSTKDIIDSKTLHLQNGNVITIPGLLRMAYLAVKEELKDGKEYKYLTTIDKIFDNIEKQIMLASRNTFAIEKNRRRLLLLRNQAQNLCWKTYWGFMQLRPKGKYNLEKRLLLAVIRETAIILQEKEEMSRDDKQLSL